MASRTKLAAVLAVALVATSCGKTSTGIEHPTDRLHFPVSLAADPSGDYLYVVSSNFDVRYRTGSVSVIDLETLSLLPDTTIGVGSFAGEIALYETGDSEHPLVGYVPAREEGALYWFDVTKDENGRPSLSCSDEPPEDATAIEECDGAHVVDSVARKRLPADDEGLTDEELAELGDRKVQLNVGRDAYGVQVVAQKDGRAVHTLVTNPRSGRIHIFRVDGGVPIDPEVPGQPAAADPEGLWEAESRLGEPVFVESVSVGGGAFAIDVSPSDGFVYSTNKFANLVVPFRLDTIADPDGEPRTWTEVNELSAFTLPSPAGTGEYARDILFSADGERAFVAYRNPSSVVVVDTSHDDDGTAANRYIATVDVGIGASSMALAASGPLGAEWLYVVSFWDERIYVIDTADLTVVDIIEVAGGPYDIVTVEAPERGRFQAYVSVFERDAVAVIELDRANPFFHQVTAYVRGVDDKGAH